MITSPGVYKNTRNAVFNEFKKDANGMIQTLKDAKELTTLKIRSSKKKEGEILKKFKQRN